MQPFEAQVKYLNQILPPDRTFWKAWIKCINDQFLNLIGLDDIKKSKEDQDKYQASNDLWKKEKAKKLPNLYKGQEPV